MVHNHELNFEREYIKCNVCNSSNYELISKVARDKQALHTVICKNCGLVFTNPMPTQKEIDNFYSQEYRLQYKGTEEPKLKHIYRATKSALERYNVIEPVIKKNAIILDVGSGDGSFLYLLFCNGYKVYGLEPNIKYAEYSRREYGIDVRTDFIETAPFKKKFFDVICIHHVLEHIRDPGAAIKTLHELLKDDGHLIIDVPNIEATYHSPNNKFHFAHLYNRHFK